MTRTRIVVALAAVAAVVLLVVVGTYVYARIEDSRAPAPLTLSTTQPSGTPGPEATGGSTTGSADDPDGSWTVSDGSVAGYRVEEVLNGQDVTVVGRTEDVSGEVEVADGALTSARVEVTTSTIATDNGRRDEQFQRILDTGAHPTATFVLDSPLDVSGIADGGAVSVEAVGELTIAGTSQRVTALVQAQLTSDGAQVSGSIPVTFADYGVEAPDLGFVSVEDTGTVEFLLELRRA